MGCLLAFVRCSVSAIYMEALHKPLYTVQFFFRLARRPFASAMGRLRPLRAEGGLNNIIKSKRIRARLVRRLIWGGV